ncbi:hypothetical protein CEXT_550911 [Caerostris extrusa]|uniref:Uncharacterized protein n=1 Tax=Caerostris extrusa TaxID=172846 RepID=A0AAV4U3N9_CAEEX|nr:hypothetical protein CEXT_550911 [Caerostris extrusa]
MRVRFLLVACAAVIALKDDPIRNTYPTFKVMMDTKEYPRRILRKSNVFLEDFQEYLSIFKVMVDTKEYPRRNLRKVMSFWGIFRNVYPTFKRQAGQNIASIWPRFDLEANDIVRNCPHHREKHTKPVWKKRHGDKNFKNIIDLSMAKYRAKKTSVQLRGT